MSIVLCDILQLEHNLRMIGTEQTEPAARPSPAQPSFATIDRMTLLFKRIDTIHTGKDPKTLLSELPFEEILVPVRGGRVTALDLRLAIGLRTRQNPLKQNNVYYALKKAGKSGMTLVQTFDTQKTRADEKTSFLASEFPEVLSGLIGVGISDDLLQQFSKLEFDRIKQEKCKPTPQAPAPGKPAEPTMPQPEESCEEQRVSLLFKHDWDDGLACSKTFSVIFTAPAARSLSKEFVRDKVVPVTGLKGSVLKIQYAPPFETGDEISLKTLLHNQWNVHNPVGTILNPVADYNTTFFQGKVTMAFKKAQSGGSSENIMIEVPYNLETKQVALADIRDALKLWVGKDIIDTMDVEYYEKYVAECGVTPCVDAPKKPLNQRLTFTVTNFPDPSKAALGEIRPAGSKRLAQDEESDVKGHVAKLVILTNSPERDRFTVEVPFKGAHITPADLGPYWERLWGEKLTFGRVTELQLLLFQSSSPYFKPIWLNELEAWDKAIKGESFYFGKNQIAGIVSEVREDGSSEGLKKWAKVNMTVTKTNSNRVTIFPLYVLVDASGGVRIDEVRQRIKDVLGIDVSRQVNHYRKDGSSQTGRYSDQFIIDTHGDQPADMVLKLGKTIHKGPGIAEDIPPSLGSVFVDVDPEDLVSQPL